MRALVFDLDDTLYVERDFVMSGYRAVARHLADANCCSFDSAFSTMAEAFDTKGRHMAFPALLTQFPNASLSLAEMVDIYRQHSPEIRLCPGYPKLLQALSREYRLGIITDGLPAVQERKVRALGLCRIMDKIIYTWEYGSEKQKPHPLSFSLMLQFLRSEPASTLYIGDNPAKDCKGAHGVGMKFVQVRQAMSCGNEAVAGEQDVPEYEIETLLQLPQLLQRLN